MENNVKKDKGKKFNRSKLLGILVFVILGFTCGFYSGIYIYKVGAKAATGNVFPMFIWLIVCIYLAMLFQIIIHEGGHFIFGKISGYQFIFFRVGSIMLLKNKGKYQLKKFKIAGTGGQCLMVPPRSDSSDFPYLLYNFGGAIANIVAAVLSLLFNLLLSDNPWLSLFLSLNLMMGFGFALINGIPMKLAGISNDGYNALYLGKDTAARKAFGVQLTMNSLLADGQRLRDMPEEWFEFSLESDLTNHFNCSIGMARCAYLSDLHRFEEARELSERLLAAPGCLDLYKNELRCELLFYELIGACREDVIKQLYTKELKKYIKVSISASIARRRLLYGYEMLANRNEMEAAKQLKVFEATTKSYPFTGEIESERELIDIINKVNQERREAEA